MTQKNVVFQYGSTNVTFLAEGDNVKVNATFCLLITIHIL